MLLEEVTKAFNSAAGSLSWPERVKWIAEQKLVSTFSTSFSLEDQIITHLIAANKIPISIFTLDTGRLFEEVQKTHQKTLDTYGIKIETYYPETNAVQDFVKTNGINGFYNSIELRKSCCHIRKVEPLNRALQGVQIWISGIRREHSEFRNDMPFAEVDSARNLIKIYPLLDAGEDEVWNYLRANNVPYNPMYEQGFASIGCAPCTRAITAGEPPRAGRWWWEQGDKKECGLHFENGRLVRSNA